MLGILVLPACTRSERLALVALLIVGLTNIIGAVRSADSSRASCMRSAIQ
ncbi:MAG TPA: hypothetical protein VGR92_07010 [Steroidobacteraceae bacterium]|nr:hypothetical protein [Steroidobacteraceae bacterium]